MSGLFTFLLILQTLIAVAMITVILMQRSEGGGLAGGSPSGLMSARGAADFLTRTTAVAATLFVALSIVLASLAAGRRAPAEFDESLIEKAQPPAGAPAEQKSSPFTPGPAPAAQPAPPAPAPNPSGAPPAQ